MPLDSKDTEASDDHSYYFMILVNVTYLHHLHNISYCCNYGTNFSSLLNIFMNELFQLEEINKILVCYLFKIFGEIEESLYIVYLLLNVA